MPVPEPTGAIAPQIVDQEGGLRIAIPVDLDPRANAGRFWTSLKPQTPVEKGQFLKAIQGKLPKLSECINTTLKVSDLIFQGVMLTDEKTGEVFPAVRSVLICPDGQMYSAVSDGIRSSLGILMSEQMFGPPPWKPPLLLRMVQVETGRGNRYFTLEYAGGESDRRK